jgi:hypothetical protein
MLSRYTLRGRRRKVRRDTESQNHYVDRVAPLTWFLFAGILFCAVADGISTLYIIRYLGLDEANPIMSTFLDIGEPWFLGVKYGVTFMALVVLVIHQNFTSILWCMGSILVFYLIILTYHGFILYYHLLGYGSTH